jgi:hypothetical protein
VSEQSFLANARSLIFLQEKPRHATGPKAALPRSCFLGSAQFSAYRHGEALGVTPYAPMSEPDHQAGVHRGAETPPLYGRRGRARTG